MSSSQPLASAVSQFQTAARARGVICGAGACLQVRRIIWRLDHNSWSGGGGCPLHLSCGPCRRAHLPVTLRRPAQVPPPPLGSVPPAGICCTEAEPPLPPQHVTRTARAAPGHVTWSLGGACHCGEKMAAPRRPPRRRGRGRRLGAWQTGSGQCFSGCWAEQLAGLLTGPAQRDTHGGWQRHRGRARARPRGELNAVVSLSKYTSVLRTVLSRFTHTTVVYIASLFETALAGAV